MPLLVHPPSSFYFLFDQIDENNWVQYSPAPEKTKTAVYPGGWAETMRHVVIWAGALKRELVTPDLWASVREEKKLATSSALATDNSPFTPEEQKRIAAALFKLREEVVSATAAKGAKLESISQRIDYLIDSSTRLGRKDYLLVLLGGLTGFVLEHTLASDKARNLFRLATQLLGWIGPDVPFLE